MPRARSASAAGPPGNIVCTATGRPVRAITAPSCSATASSAAAICGPYSPYPPK